jgi:hypothetical protein
MVEAKYFLKIKNASQKNLVSEVLIKSVIFRMLFMIIKV